MSTRAPDERGFTLIELMVVVLVIAILLAIAIPTFLGARERAQDNAAKTSLGNAERVARGLVLDEGSFPNRATLLTLLPQHEPTYTWIDHTDPSTGPDEISVDETAGGTELALAARSESGTCFYLRVVEDGVSARHAADAASCESHDFQNGAGSGW